MPPVDPRLLPPGWDQPQVSFPPRPVGGPGNEVSFTPRQPQGRAPKTTYSAPKVDKELGVYQTSSEGKIDVIAKPEKEKPEKFREPVDELMNVIRASAEATRVMRKGMAQTPVTRWVGAKLPTGNKGRDLQGYVNTIAANTAFETLQQMREQSPTGGAVGNVSDKDMELLRSTISSLDPGQSNEKFRADLVNVLKTYRKVLEKLPGGKEAYSTWRKEWLGFDPIPVLKKRQQQQRGKVSSDIDDILKKYGAK